MADSSPALVVSLHDVSPHTFEASRQIIEELADAGVDRTSLLVVPDHHQRGHFLASPPFCDWLRDLQSAGHEAVIHGYIHRRARQSGESLLARLTTRIYTADEGEFFDVDRATATALVSKAREEFRSTGLNPSGFIAPAWLLSQEAEQALKELGIRYTTRLANVLDLQTGEVTRSQSLVWSVRSGWRRKTSLLWNAALYSRLSGNDLVRISIHPVDIQHRQVWRQILRLVKHAASQRHVITYEQWVEGRLPALTGT